MTRIRVNIVVTGAMLCCTALLLDRANAAEEDPADFFSGRIGRSYDLKEPFDADRLRHLAKQSSRNADEQVELGCLLLHAGLEGDKSFLGLLKEREWREVRFLDVALSAYDYMVSNSEAALDNILAELATEDIGSDSGTIMVLSVIDEWDRTMRAFRKHFVHTDGAGGMCYAAFLGNRKFLYPREYERMRDLIEAPVKWAEPLLPKEGK